MAVGYHCGPSDLFLSPLVTLMKTRNAELRARGPSIFALALVLSGLSCNSLGPSAIRNGREAYNEAIRVTDEQQLLKALVMLRYGSWGSMLAVTSVTANVRVRASAAVEAGFGPDRDYAGSLVPLAVGIVYEENPTISYAPLQGEQFIRQLMAPLPLDLFVLLVSGLDPSWTFAALVRRVNDMRNLDFLPPSVEPDLRFKRLTELFTALSHEGRLEFGASQTLTERRIR